MGILAAGKTLGRRMQVALSRCLAALVVLGALAIGLTPATAAAQDPNPAAEQEVINVYFVAGQSNAYNLHVERFQPGIDEHVPDTETITTIAANGAHAATSLYKDWRADGTPDADPDGSFYVRFQGIVHDTLAELRAENPNKTVRLAGIWWHQGEADAKYEQHSQAYAERLQTLIHDMRVTFDEPDLPFFLARIMLLNRDYWDVVRDQLVLVGREDPRVWTVDLDTVDDALLYGFHYTVEGYRELGRRAAKTYAEVVALPGDGCGTYLVDIEGCLIAHHQVGCDLAPGADEVPATTTVEITLENRADVAIAAQATVHGLASTEVTVGPRGVEVISSGPLMAADPLDLTVMAGPVVALKATVDPERCDYVLHDVDDSGSFDSDDVGSVLNHLVGRSAPVAVERAFGDDRVLGLADALRMVKCLDPLQVCAYE